MPKVRFHPLIEEIHGTMYDVVFKRSPKENIIVTKRPDMSKVNWSQAQKQQRQRFARAGAYAKAALADPDVCAIYHERAAIENKRASYIAFSDYMNGKNLFSR